MKYLQIILLISFLIFSCKSEPETADQQTDESSKIIIHQKEEKIILTSNIQHLRVRDKAGKEGETLKMLSAGEKVIYLNEKSDFTDAVTLRGILFEEPWLKIQFDGKKEGWVFAGGMRFDYENPPKSLAFLIDKRLKTYLRTGFDKKINTYQDDFQKVNDSKELASIFRESQNLKKDINKILENKPTIEDPQKAPNLGWLEASLPGMAGHLVAEGTIFYLFDNYKKWYKKARKTSGREDDDFFKVCFDIFPIDSIEHFYPSWFLQTWDYGGHSELGKGIHNEILGKLNRLLAESDLFLAEINAFKTQILEDITSEEKTYWLDKKAILAEIDKIIAADYGILSEDDKIALQTRKQQFENAEENGIKLNHREGVHDFQTVKRKME